MDASTSEIPKAYEPAAVEAKWQTRWLEAGCFTAETRRVNAAHPAFSLVIPPPNITGVLTLGHVLNNTIQDILARRARQTGHEVLWLPGTDHAGLATQTAVEKALRKEEKKTRHDLGREEFLRRTWDWQRKHGNIIIEQLKRLGCSCDWSRQRFTLDDDYAAAVAKVFVDLHAKGYIYRGKRMVNWDPVALTALSDEEVIPRSQKSALYYVKYAVVDQPDRFLEVATTRPETIMADLAVAVNPEDPRYADLVGKQVYRPFPKEAIPVIADAAVDLKFGTGALKITPAHDKLDFEIGQRHGLGVVDALHPDGKINAPTVPELDGLDRFAARAKAGELLAAMGLLSKEEPHENNVGFSERSEVPIEPRLSEQWFLRYPKTAEALAVVRDGLIRFFPQHWEKVYAQWLENIQDWCISRQVWWGHRVPAWYGPEGETRVQIESPGEGWTQDLDTLDTWFSSWLWAYETMDAETRAKFYPTDVLVTGPDIIFFWVARMIIAGLEFQPGKTSAPEDNIPFRNVYFTGLIRDSKGKKMSKSLGNSPDVLGLIEKYGADGVRFGLLRIAPQGQDIRFDEKQVEEGRNFANKIWNAARFYQMQEPALPFGTRVSYRPAPYVLDIESKLRDTQIAVAAAYREFRFSEAAQLLYNFFWSDYCDWFVEAAKADIVGVDSVQPGQRVTERGLAKHVALFTMYRVLTNFLELLHPFMPHLTEELTERLSFPPRPVASTAPAAIPAQEANAAEAASQDLPHDTLPATEEAADHAKPMRRSQFLLYRRLGDPIQLSGSPEEVAEARFATQDLYAAVSAARNLRAEYGVATNKPAKFILQLRDELLEDATALANIVRALTRMINAEELALKPDYEAPRGTPSARTPLGDLFMPLAGLIDVDAERARLQKEITKAEADLQTALKKLGSESFVNHAPPAVVAEIRQRQTDNEVKLTKLRGMLEALG